MLDHPQRPIGPPGHSARRTAGRTIVLAFCLAVGVGAFGGCGSGGSSSTVLPGSPSAADLAPVKGNYEPSIDPGKFVSAVDNRYLPYQPGTALHYVGVAENGKTAQTTDVTVTDRTRKVLGVTCMVIRDVVSQGGRQMQRTFDWVAQDMYGDVWYMGEHTYDFKHGRWVKAIDSGPAGVRGAKPGILMAGAPKPSVAYRQYYWPKHAEDQAKVLGTKRSLTVPAGTFHNVLVTIETSAIEPGVAEKKYNAAGVGVVKEQVVRGNHERFDLASVKHS